MIRSLFLMMLWLLPCFVCSCRISLSRAHLRYHGRLAKLLCGVDLLGEDLLELLGCGLLDALGNLGGASSVADLAGLVV